MFRILEQKFSLYTSALNREVNDNWDFRRNARGVKSIKDMMVKKTETLVGDRVYYECSIFEVEVVLTFLRWGKAASASTTTIVRIQ